MHNSSKNIIIYNYTIPLKYITLLILVFQVTTMVLVLRKSRTADELYITSTAILLAETLKLIVCTLLVYYEEGNFQNFVKVIKEQAFGNGWDTFKIFVPACLYVIQNNLLYIAISKLDAGTYQVTYQLKILTTAFFSVFLLSKHLDLKKWASLIILTIGVSLVQLSLSTNNSKDGDNSENQYMGLFCIIGACCISGLAGVYLEKVLKFSKPSVWVRNIQLSLFSLIPALFAVFWSDGNTVITKGFLYGYTPIVWFVVVLQACSGLAVALVVKYADNILKGFASSISIILCSIASMFIFNFEPTLQWVFGASLVILATVLYSRPSKQPIVPPELPIKATQIRI